MENKNFSEEEVKQNTSEWIEALIKQDPRRAIEEAAKTQDKETLQKYLKHFLIAVSGEKDEFKQAVLISDGRHAFGYRIDWAREQVAVYRQTGHWMPDPADLSVTAESIESHLTDLGNARRLVRRYGTHLRYVTAWRTWFVWDGTRWAKDETDEVTRLAKDTARAILTEAAACKDDGERKRIVNWAMDSQSAQRLRAMIELARSERPIAVRPSELDTDEWLLNCRNGTLDLRTGELHPHRPEDMITKLVPVDYDPKALCPQWDAFLERIMGGNAKLVYFLQKAAGYSLTGDMREQCMFIMHGEGANGKSTFIETIKRVMGDYARHTASTTLMAKKGESTPNDVAALVGARMVATAETQDGKRLDEAQIKQLTGGDTVSTRRLYQEWFQFTPTFKIWLATNHLPEIRGTDHAIWRRIRLIPFNVTIPDAERDLTLASKLVAEAPGILRWAVEGCLAWQSEGLQMPSAMQDATAAYRQSMDCLTPFLDAWCVVGPGERVLTGDLLKKYKEWAEDEHAVNEHTNADRWMSAKRFSMLLAERGFQTQRLGDNRFYLGLKVKGY